jgi:hypothetical protein
VELLRDLVERSRRYLLTAIREGIDNGRIRADIEPEVLLVPIAGTIHALLGMPSIHDVAADGGARDPDRVLAGLEVLLASSGQRSASPGGKKKTKRTRNTKRNANPSVSRRRRKT